MLLCQGRYGSRRCRWRRRVLIVCFEGAVDGAGEVALEAAEGFLAALAFRLFAREVGARGRMVLALRDGDPVQRAVELAVARAVEAVAVLSTRPPASRLRATR